jgi:hypothetical protein
MNNAAQTVVISSQNDPWPLPVKKHAAAADDRYSFISLHGSHNHLWQAPEQYVELINAYAARLLA